MGIGVGTPKLDLPTMLKFKDEAVDGNVKGVDFLLKKNKIDAVHGTGRIARAGQGRGEGRRRQDADARDQEHRHRHRLRRREARAASTSTRSASSPRTSALALDKVPERLLVIGAGVIGLELGSVWRRLGAQGDGGRVPRPHPAGHGQRSRRGSRSACSRSRASTFKLGSKVTGVDASGATLKAQVEPAKGGAAETIEADVVLVAIGRVPYTEGLGLEGSGRRSSTTAAASMSDAHFATNVKGIYAIGDVIAGPMLAHKAEDEGMAVAEILAGQAGHVNYDVIPNVVYTFPEIASVGKTEEELKAAGVAYNAGKFPFTANGRAKANQQTDGFVKILADAKTDRVLGVHIVGSDAGNMIAEAAVAMEFGASSEDIARTCHAHPTLPEAVKEAALAVEQARDSYVGPSRCPAVRRSNRGSRAERPKPGKGRISGVRVSTLDCAVRTIDPPAPDSARDRLPGRGVAVGASRADRRLVRRLHSVGPPEGARRARPSNVCRPTRRCWCSSCRWCCLLPLEVPRALDAGAAASGSARSPCSWLGQGGRASASPLHLRADAAEAACSSRWFRWLYEHMLVWLAWAHGLVDPIKAADQAPHASNCSVAERAAARCGCSRAIRRRMRAQRGGVTASVYSEQMHGVRREQADRHEADAEKAEPDRE